MGNRYESYNMVNEDNEPTWKTADGLEIPFSKVTHQHWSNVYWYHRYIVEKTTQELTRSMYFIHGKTALIKKCNWLLDIALEQIKLRFDGDILDWVPLYENEKEWFEIQNTRKILIEKYQNYRPLRYS